MAPLWPRTPPSLQSCRSPALRVKSPHYYQLSNDFKNLKNISVYIFLSLLNHQTQPRPLTGFYPPITPASLWSAAALFLVHSNVYGVHLDLEQAAHPVRRNHQAAAQHSVVHCSQLRQASSLQIGQRPLQRHVSMNRLSPGSDYMPAAVFLCCTYHCFMQKQCLNKKK